MYTFCKQYKAEQSAFYLNSATFKRTERNVGTVQSPFLELGYKNIQNREQKILNKMQNPFR